MILIRFLIAALILTGSIFMATPLLADQVPSEPSLMQEFPKLQNYTSGEPDTHVRIGVGVAPFGEIRNQLSFSANLFQFHWINPTIDWEVFSVSYASTMGGDEVSKSKSFVFRTVPKYRLNDTFSVGPLLGYEFVSFPNLTSQIYNGTLATPPEGFSSRGVIYGGALSENFKINKDFSLKLNQVVYRQTYSTSNAYENGWVYKYGSPALNHDQGPISAGTVLLMEFSILY